jgi:hypothetical protein
MKLHGILVALTLAFLVPSVAHAAEPPATDPQPQPSVPEPAGE